MKDFQGNDLAIGDEVIYVQKNYRSLKIGRIVEITERTIVIEQKNTNRKFRQMSDQVSKVLDARDFVAVG